MAVASWCLASEKVHGLTLPGTGILISFYENDLLPFFLGSFNSFFYFTLLWRKRVLFLLLCYVILRRPKMFLIDVNTKDGRELYRRRPSDFVHNIIV
jgi:hypothetical protein